MPINFKIDKFLLEDVENDKHPSEFEIGEGYAILILRLPEVISKKIKVTSYAFAIKDDKIFIWTRDKKDFSILKGSFDELYGFLDTKIDDLLKNIQMHHNEIENMEETLYDGNISSKFMRQWLSYKKDISLIHRLMFHAEIAFEQFIRYYKKHNSFENFAYNDLLEHIKRIKELSREAIEKLDNLYDFYRDIVDERMNKNMYWLTIISAIFLPLTLITGFLE